MSTSMNLLEFLMNKNLILPNKIYFSWLFRKYNIYCRNIHSSSLLDKHTIIPEDIFSATDYRNCDHEASIIENDLIDNIIRKKRTNFLSKWGGPVYRDYFNGKDIIKEAKKILVIFKYAEKVRSACGPNEHFYIWPTLFSFPIYREMARMEVLPKNVSLHPIGVFSIRVFSFFIQILFLFKTLFFLEINTIRMIRLKTNSRNNYQTIVHLDNGILSYKFDDVIENKIFRLFDKDSTLFISDGINEEKQGWLRPLKSKGYNAVSIKHSMCSLNPFIFIAKIYPGLFFWRLNLLALMIYQPWASPSCYRALKYRALWESFYYKNKVSNSVILMIEENLTASIVHKYNGVSTFFVYLSTTESIVQKSLHPTISSCHDYTHMISDYVISSEISNDWIKTHQNNVGEYINIGPIFSDIVVEQKDNRKNFRTQLGLPEDIYIVSFFDHTIGHIGVLTEDSYFHFLQGMLDLAMEFENIVFLFKSKKSYAQIIHSCAPKILACFAQIQAANNCIYFNDYSTETASMDSLSLIGVSDLVISAPLSSIIYESLSGSVRTIAYDPLAQYQYFDVPSCQMPYIYAKSYEELRRLFEYWISSTDGEVHSYIESTFNDNYGLNFAGDFVSQFKLILSQKPME